jgi:succinate dehydrogenase/fumarate reductase flavoprotein subunit
MIDILVIGAGPAGVLAALRAADLGARTVLVTRSEFGGMAANDGRCEGKNGTNRANAREGEAGAERMHPRWYFLNLGPVPFETKAIGRHWAIKCRGVRACARLA